MKAIHYAIILIVILFILHHRDNSEPEGYNLEKYENFPNTAEDPFVQKEMYRYPPRDPCRLNNLQFNCYDSNESIASQSSQSNSFNMPVCAKPVDNSMCRNGNYLMGRSNGTPRKCRSIQ
jgi:hypothetical protein